MRENAYIYLDHAATTAMREEVREAMRPYESERFGNPSSAHRWGRQARGALEESRAEALEIVASHRVGKQRRIPVDLSGQRPRVRVDEQL